jgi:hypothetical protein
VHDPETQADTWVERNPSIADTIINREASDITMEMFGFQKNLFYFLYFSAQTAELVGVEAFCLH